MKNPPSLLQITLSLSLALSLSGQAIGGQTVPARRRYASPAAASQKVEAITESAPAGDPLAPPLHPDAVTMGPSVSIDAASGRHPISPYIYGINYDQNQIQDINPAVIRWGGDATSQYNWLTGNTNAGSDWYYINGNQSSGSNPTDFETFFQTNHTAGVQTIGTVPINGWVAKDSGACGFSVGKYGAQQKTDPYSPDCGNGILPDGQTPITQKITTSPSDADIAVEPGFVQDWVTSVVTNHGSTANGGVAIWELDNEPVWWSGVHQNIHPAYTVYDEVWQKGLAYAQAIKAADPTAKVAGPITAGWGDLFFSRQDFQSGWSTGPNYVYWGNPSDRMAHGNQDFVAWYLQQFAGYESQHGQRLLDYFDIHGYMPGTGGDSVDAASNAARFESTRVFWDPTFTPPGTNEYLLNTPANPNNNPSAPCVCLIPRMKNWVNANYPGTRLSITEYNLGAQGDLNGALAETDLLGIFGREGLDVATLWPFLGYPDIPLKAPITYAFRLYRNYDGAKSAFGETGVSAVSANQSLLSVYAALRATDGALTIVIVNKTGNDLTSSLTLANFPAQATAQVFRYGAANLTGIQPQPNQTVASAGFSATFPANSATLFVIPQASTATIAADPNPIPVGPGAAVGQTTISWTAGSSSAVEVHIGTAAGTLFASGGSTGSAQTGHWVSNGMKFVLVDSTTQTAIASTTVTLAASSGSSITANPNPITVAPGAALGQTTISWNAPGSSVVEVHVGNATGTLFALGQSSGSAQTGVWVATGTQFVLVDAATRATLATTTVTLTFAGQSQIVADPNPIPVAQGAVLGQTTISWNAPGSSLVEVHVGAPAGTLFASGGSTGSQQTGPWVSSGMVFVLVDATTHVTLTSMVVTLATPGGAATITANPNPVPAVPAVTTISWSAPGHRWVEVHVGAATGTLFASGGPTGSQLTGDWVGNGLTFVLVDPTSHTVLASTAVYTSAPIAQPPLVTRSSFR